MNRNKSLIEGLRGKVKDFATMAEDLKGLDRYLEDGFHIDTELVTALLDLLCRMVEAESTVRIALVEVLGVDPDADVKKKKAESEGAKWSVEEILRHCELGEDNVMRLPRVQFNKKSYAEAKKWIEEAGGSWQGGKVQGFTFPFDPKRVFGILHEGKRCNLAQDYQFFETPDSLADWLVGLAGGVESRESILEPSAGSGAIVRAIVRACPAAAVDCYELMPENRELLSKIPQAEILGKDFSEASFSLYDKIIANPPFSNNQDIDHVMHMYRLLAPGGTMASIMSNHWTFATEKKCVEFRDWLKSVGAEQYPIEEGTFSESGTNVKTVAVVIRKEL